MKLGHRRKDHNWLAVWRIFSKTKPAPPLVCGVSGARQQIYLEPGQTSGPGLARRLQSLYWLLSKLVFTEKSYEHSFSLWRWYLPSSLCLSVCLESTIHSPSLQLFMQSVFSSPSCLPFSVSLYGGAYLCMSVFYAKIGLNVPISNYNLFWGR